MAPLLGELRKALAQPDRRGERLLPRGSAFAGIVQLLHQIVLVLPLGGGRLFVPGIIGTGRGLLRVGVHPDKIMIGNIMLVIPGIQLTTSLRDMINGDTISGLLNLSEAILKAISVALGFALVLLAGGV